MCWMDFTSKYPCIFFLIARCLSLPARDISLVRFRLIRMFPSLESAIAVAIRCYCMEKGHCAQLIGGGVEQQQQQQETSTITTATQKCYPNH